MRKKKFDVFMCYSHIDRKLVEEIADTLNQLGIKVWYDEWEMRPGSVLLRSISKGIENADYFLVIISNDSINSSWVEYELTSVMIEEIENQHVKVIPSIAGNIEYKQLPTDLRAKYSLDFRNAQAFQKSIEGLSNLIRPDVRKRQELLDRLRNPIKADSQTIQELRRFAIRYGDQPLQIAALTGLEKIGGPESVLAVTERLLNTWGVSGIAKSIKSLEKLRNDGGLLVLTASILHDHRFYSEKLEAIYNGARKLNAIEVVQVLTSFRANSETLFFRSDIVAELLEKLASVSFNDVRYGAIIAKSTSRTRAWAESVTLPKIQAFDEAWTYAEQRVPDLRRVINTNGLIFRVDWKSSDEK